jgi:predicted ATP-grasp superfamily ATP-dependent carboligase
MRFRRFVIVWSLSAWLVAALHAQPPFAFIVVGTFLAVCPGAPFVKSFRADDPLRFGVILLATSLALAALVSETLFYLHAFTGARAIAILAIIAIVGSLRPGGGTRARTVRARNGVELDPELPVLLVRIGRYPVYHGTIGAIRSFGRAGVPVYAIVEDAFTPAAMSRYLTGKFVWPTNGNESEEYLLEGLSRIGEQLGGGVLAIPSDDEAAVFLAEHASKLREWFVIPEIDPSLPRRLASKRGLFGLCRKHDVATPRSWFPSSIGRARAFARRAEYPVIVKNVDPFLRLNQRAVPGTTTVHSEEELLALIDTFPDARTAMFQEYIPVEDAEDWIFHGYFDVNAEPVVQFTGIKLRSWPPRAGVTTYARIVGNDELAELSTRFCRAIGYHGVVDLDWRFDRRDGQYKLVDFNPRHGAQFKLFENEHGIDVLTAMHLDLTDGEVPASPPLYGRGFRVEHLDVPAAMAYHHTTAPAPEGAADGPRPVRAWLAADDLMPFVMMLVRFTPTVLSRLRSSRRRTARRDAPSKPRRAEVGAADEPHQRAERTR